MTSNMATCGIPTVTCVLLLLFMAVLYSTAHANADTSLTVNQDISEGDVEMMDARFRRSARQKDAPGDKASRKGNKRGPQEKIDGNKVSAKRNGGKKKEKGKKKQAGKKSSGNAIPPGVNRKTLAFAERVGSANSQFASKVMKAIYPKIQYNTIISPLSIHTAMSMVLLGARKTTERELSLALGLRQAKVEKGQQVHKGYQTLLAMLTSVNPNVNLNIANAVFVKPNIPVEAAYRNSLISLYNATFESFNFSNPAGPEAPINDWVYNATSKKIKDLLSPGTINSLTSMVLVNALFFNASWDRPFSEGTTSMKPFNTLSQGVKDVETMETTNIFSHVNNSGAEVIELPFRGDRMAMYIILPSRSSSVDQIVEELSNTQKYGQDAADRIFRNMEPASIHLELPKFKIESTSLKLKSSLQSLGIKEAFSDKADLSGISSVDLSIDDVIHKAFIDVNERGTEASAATAALLTRRSRPTVKSTDVKVDRPFVFAIRDKPTKAVLFVGAFVGQTS
ncbi:Serpin B6 [Biomphalaria glabrata]|nr:serpin A3-6-like [Biomphalaria glabrata]